MMALTGKIASGEQDEVPTVEAVFAPARVSALGPGESSL